MLLAMASTNILLNGLPGPKIWHARGLRQVNAFSPPHLFLLVMDALSLLFAKAEVEGLLERFPAPEAPNLR
jgi:hypothetical protein